MGVRSHMVPYDQPEATLVSRLSDPPNFIHKAHLTAAMSATGFDHAMDPECPPDR